MQRLDAGGVWLELGEPARPDELDVHVVGDAPAVELGEAGPLVLADGDDDLAAHLVGDAVLGTELDHPLPPESTQSGLVRPGLVVDAGMDHPGVASGLVPGDRAFLVDDDDPAARPRRHDRMRGRQSDDAGADHHHVSGIHGSEP